MQSGITIPQHVIIATHTLFYGASEALRDYLTSKKVKKLYYFGQTLRPESPFYIYLWDAIKTFITCIMLPKGSYRFFGVNPVNAALGIVLRSIGKVKSVTFYAIDFVPRRFHSLLLNRAYHALEAFVVTHADECWNVSPKIAEGRKMHLSLNPSSHPQRVVPIGVWKKDIVRTVKRGNSFRIVFAGHLLEKQGVQVVLRALSQVKKTFPAVRFTIIGGGPYEHALRMLCKEISLGRIVRFTGWESDQSRIRRELLRSDVAVAVYMEDGRDEENFTYYADPTKIKTYLAAGLPVIMTNVSHNASTLAHLGVAFLVRYQVEDVAHTLRQLFGPSQVLQSAKEKARKVAQTFTWEHIFDCAFTSL